MLWLKALIAALGGNPKTITSFAGVGDLLLTCTSTKSRNYTLGKLIGEGKSKEEINNYRKAVKDKTNLNILDKDIKPYDLYRVSIQSLNGEWSSGYLNEDDVPSEKLDKG